jgi:hypothetical protein
VEARLFQHAVSRTAPTYAVPYVFGVTLLFAILCLGGALIAADWMRILLAVLGSIAASFALSLMACAAIVRPEMLRSERHVERMSIARIIGDKEMDPAVRDRLSDTVFDDADQPRPKHASGLRPAPHEDASDSDA